MIKIVYGDLLDAREDIIGHQVNCQGKMGSGVALQVKKKYPRVYKYYLMLLEESKTRNISLLGTNHCVNVENNKWVVNMFGQDKYGYDGNQYTDLKALKECLKELRELAEHKNFSVALPYLLGSDRGGADWKEVEQLILSAFDGYEVTLYKR